MGKGPILMTQKKPETGDLLRDTLDLLILKTLSRGEMHGYDRPARPLRSSTKLLSAS